MPSSLGSKYQRLARKVRHLQITFELLCEGGGLGGRQLCPVRAADLATVCDLPKTFKRLRSLDIVIDNNQSNIAPGVAYYYFRYPLQLHRQRPNREVYYKRLQWLHNGGNVEIPSWRQALTVRKRLKFVQSMADQRATHLHFAAPRFLVTTKDEARFVAEVHATFDAPVAVCSYCRGPDSVAV